MDCQTMYIHIYKCNQCDHKATTKDSLKKHVDSIYEGVCYSQCDHKATSKQNLKRGLESIHVGSKVSCSQCDYKAT